MEDEKQEDSFHGGSGSIGDSGAPAWHLHPGLAAAVAAAHVTAVVVKEEREEHAKGEGESCGVAADGGSEDPRLHHDGRLVAQRHAGGDDLKRMERGRSMAEEREEEHDSEGGGAGEGSGGGLMKLTRKQVAWMEAKFEEDMNLDIARRVEIAKELGVRPRQVGVWFQNRRARWKIRHKGEQLEALKEECRKWESGILGLQGDYELLKSDYEELLSHNARLQTKVDSLLAELLLELTQTQASNPLTTSTSFATFVRHNPIAPPLTGHEEGIKADYLSPIANKVASPAEDVLAALLADFNGAFTIECPKQDISEIATSVFGDNLSLSTSSDIELHSFNQNLNIVEELEF